MTGCSSNLLFTIYYLLLNIESACISVHQRFYYFTTESTEGTEIIIDFVFLSALGVHALWLLFGLAHCFDFLVSERPVVDSQVGHLERPVGHVAAVRLADGPVVP